MRLSLCLSLRELESVPRWRRRSAKFVLCLRQIAGRAPPAAAATATALLKIIGIFPIIGTVSESAT